MSKKLYSLETVFEAIRITAMGAVGILDKEEAEAALSKMPEDVSRYVMASTVAAHETQKIAMARAMEKILAKISKEESDKSEK